LHRIEMEQTVTTVKETAVVQKEVAPPPYKPYRTWLCCTKYKDRSQFQNILLELDLTNVQKEIVKMRYLSIVENYQRRSRNYSYIFFSGHFIITVGSLFVPALLSIQNSDQKYVFTGNSFSTQIYWSTFVISLLVTIFNGILTLFKVDKKYYFLNTVLERLRSEGWQYFSLTGRYDGRLLKNEKPNHKNQFVHFMHYVEKIKLKQVEEEYYKADEKIGQVQGTNGQGQNGNGGGNQEFFPPSIDQPLTNMAGAEPDPVKRALNSIILSQKTVQETDRNENVTVIPERERQRDEEESGAGEDNQSDNDSSEGRDGPPYDSTKIVVTI
jgi:hypothetical protein